VIFFIFYTVDYMLPGMLSAWLQEFWEPLVARAKEMKPKCETHLLMFLVDIAVAKAVRTSRQ
jgi:hypothetical protein